MGCDNEKDEKRYLGWKKWRYLNNRKKMDDRFSEEGNWREDRWIYERRIKGKINWKFNLEIGDWRKEIWNENRRLSKWDVL